MIPEFKLPSYFTNRSEKGRKPTAPIVFNPRDRRGTKILRYVEEAASNSTDVVHEGSPIYLWPDRQRPTQQWDNPAFMGGHEIIVALASILPLDVVRHAVLIDDFNGRPRGAGEADVESQLIALYRSSSALANSPVFDSSSHPRTRRYVESSFTTEGGANNCSNLDGGFQKEKLITLSDTGGKESVAALNEILIVIAHPTTFMAQQRSMLASLLSEMKKPPFDAISKADRRALITRIFRHIWLNDTTGQLEAITQPVWNKDKNRFDFQEVVTL